MHGCRFRGDEERWQASRCTKQPEISWEYTRAPRFSHPPSLKTKCKSSGAKTTQHSLTFCELGGRWGIRPPKCCNSLPQPRPLQLPRRPSGKARAKAGHPAPRPAPRLPSGTPPPSCAAATIARLGRLAAGNCPAPASGLARPGHGGTRRRDGRTQRSDWDTRRAERGGSGPPRQEPPRPLTPLFLQRHDGGHIVRQVEEGEHGQAREEHRHLQ